VKISVSKGKIIIEPDINEELLFDETIEGNLIVYKKSIIIKKIKRLKKRNNI